MNSVHRDFKLRLQSTDAWRRRGTVCLGAGRMPRGPRPPVNPKGQRVRGALRSPLRGLCGRARLAPRPLSPAFQGPGTPWALGRPRGETASTAYLGPSARSMDTEPSPQLWTVRAATPTGLRHPAAHWLFATLCPPTSGKAG